LQASAPSPLSWSSSAAKSECRAAIRWNRHAYQRPDPRGGSLEDSAYTGEAELTRYEVVDGKERQTDLLDVNLAAIRRNEPGADLELKPYDFLVIKKTPQWRLPDHYAGW